MPITCGFGHRRTSTFQGLHKAATTHNCGISSKSQTPAIRFLLASFLKGDLQSTSSSDTPIHRPSEQSSYSPFSPHGRNIGERLHSSFRPPFSSLPNSLSVHSGLPILPIPSKPLRFSICEALIQDLSFSFYIVVSLS